MSVKYDTWIVVHVITFSIGSLLGIITGKIVNELFFLFFIPFMVVVLLGQYFLMKDDIDWTKVWVQHSALGFTVGTVLALGQIFALLAVVNLIINHGIAIIVLTGSTLFFQYRVLETQIDSNMARSMVYLTLAAMLVASVIVTLLSLFVDMHLDILAVAYTSYHSLFPWVFTSAIFGLSYGVFTGKSIQEWS